MGSFTSVNLALLFISLGNEKFNLEKLTPWHLVFKKLSLFKKTRSNFSKHFVLPFSGFHQPEFCECRPTNTPGSVTHTRITNFPDIYTQLANPCGIIPAPANTFPPTTTPTPTVSTNTVNIMDFYHSLESALRHASQKLSTLLTEDPVTIIK